MKKIFNIQTLVFLAVLLLPAIVRADDPPSFVDGVNDAPIDGGLSLLVAAGVGYGVKKLREKKQQKDTDVLDK